jgi:hypothetical protein
MSYNPLSNAITGIQLAQNGRKMEALAYLREAVRREPINAEVWLWLAHVTPDAQEYQNCVYQALVLAPNHVIARQMQDVMMQAQAAASGSMMPMQQNVPQAMYNTAQMNPQVLVQVQQKQQRRWWFRRFLILAVGGILIGAVVAGLMIFAEDSNLSEAIFEQVLKLLANA